MHIKEESCTHNSCTLSITSNYTIHMYTLHNRDRIARWKKKLWNINKKNCNSLKCTMWTLESLKVYSLEFGARTMKSWTPNCGRLKHHPVSHELLLSCYNSLISKTLETKIIDAPLRIKEQGPSTSWNLELTGHNSQLRCCVTTTSMLVTATVFCMETG
jgi:hypothetical protein